MQSVNVGFHKRLSTALKWEDEVKNRLETMGFLTNRYGTGVQLTPEFHDAVRFMNDNYTAQFVRYLPDWIIAIKNKMCYLVEAKSERSNTSNFSYELASYEVGLRLHSIGVNVIVIFTGWKVDFIQNLKIWKEFKDPTYLQRVKQNGGSGTPFGLIKKDNVPTFDDFFVGLLSCNVGV